MNNGFYLEVIACNVADAVAAEQGGADRIELISNYEVGGLTPPFELVREVVAAVKIPVRVMLRHKESFYLTDEAERAALCNTALEMSRLPIDGLVLGFLKWADSTSRPEIDLPMVEQVLALVPDLGVTFHRASEELTDPGLAIEILRPYPAIDTLLTSGGPGPWSDKVDLLSSWVIRAAPDKTILLGGGVDEEAIRLMRRVSPLQAFHLGQAVRADRRIDGPVIASEVARLAELIVQGDLPR